MKAGITLEEKKRLKAEYDREYRRKNREALKLKKKLTANPKQEEKCKKGNVKNAKIITMNIAENQNKEL